MLSRVFRSVTMALAGEYHTRPSPFAQRRPCGALSLPPLLATRRRLLNTLCSFAATYSCSKVNIPRSISYPPDIIHNPDMISPGSPLPPYLYDYGYA